MGSYCPFRGNDCREDCTFFGKEGCLLRDLAEKATCVGTQRAEHMKKKAGAPHVGS